MWKPWSPTRANNYINIESGIPALNIFFALICGFFFASDIYLSKFNFFCTCRLSIDFIILGVLIIWQIPMPMTLRDGSNHRYGQFRHGCGKDGDLPWSHHSDPLCQRTIQQCRWSWNRLCKAWRGGFPVRKTIVEITDEGLHDHGWLFENAITIEQRLWTYGCNSLKFLPFRSEMSDIYRLSGLFFLYGNLSTADCQVWSHVHHIEPVK